ncbi:hypothetical protein D3C84_613270 [compost metagenome]
MVTGKAQYPVPLIPQTLVLMFIASTVRPLGLLHHHSGPTALFVIMRVRQHQSIQLIWQRTAQQDSYGHARGFATTQGLAEMSQQPLSGLHVQQVIGHQILIPLRIVLGGHLQGTEKLVTPQIADVTG